MADIRYLVPYEIRVKAADITSGRSVSNLFYLRTSQQIVAPPAYGASIVGGGSTATLLANFWTNYSTNVLPLLSAKYKLSVLEMRAILGWQYPTAKFPVSGLGVGNPTLIQTTSTNSLKDGQLVSINGVVGATNANGIFVASNVDSVAKTFEIPANTSTQVWGGGGTWQKVKNQPSWVYGELELLPDSSVGGISGECVALFAAASVRRTGYVAGKSWQGRNSYSPIGEGSVEDGAFTSAAKTA